MQAREIRLLTTEEIRERLDDAYRELFVLRREMGMGRLGDTNRIKMVRRDIARMKTILRERELLAGLLGEEVAQ
ncbi:MAG: 50S ribosomal protein L29 [Anaerolineae bacterium]|nr:50S ribosomal protein L29 [Anaerolineae bacterium]